MYKKIKSIIKLIRVKQWVKNGLILFPLIFAKAFHSYNISKSLKAVLVFCLLSSCIYIINDIVDVKEDRKNEYRKKRPIASGDISIKFGIFLAIVLFILSMVGNYFIQVNYLISYGLLLGYLVLNLFYSFFGKKLPIIDAFILMICYIIRIYYGAFIIQEPVSDYLFLTVMSCALFLAFGKRNKEYQFSKQSRSVLKEYPPVFLDRCTYLCLTLTIVFYSLWVIEQEHPYIMCTVPLLVLLLLRYTYVLEKRKYGDPTNVFFSDWVLCILAVIYFSLVMVIFIGV